MLIARCGGSVTDMAVPVVGPAGAERAPPVRPPAGIHLFGQPTVIDSIAALTCSAVAAEMGELPAASAAACWPSSEAW